MARRFFNRNRRFSRSVTWRKKSWVGSSVTDAFQFTESSFPGVYQSDVLFVPLVQVVDYATYPLEELGGPVIPQGSTQERIRLLRCTLDAEYRIDTRTSPTGLFDVSVAWYLAKFSLQEVSNAIAVGGAGLFPYDPLSNTAEHLFKHPVVRFGSDFYLQQFPGTSESSEFSGIGLDPRHIRFNAKMRLGLETDEEFYLVFTCSLGGPEEVTNLFGALSLQARTQFAT